METGKTIERQARGSLSLLNNFCILKFNRAPRRVGDTFVVGRGDTISASEPEIRPNVELPFPHRHRLRQHKQPGSNYFAGIYHLLPLRHENSSREEVAFQARPEFFIQRVFYSRLKKDICLVL